MDKNANTRWFNKSRKLQEVQAMKLHEEADVAVNDHGNNLFDVERFAKRLDIEINIIDSKQFNSIVHMANKRCENKIYLYKTRNHFDVIKSLTAFYETPYYCHECKKAYTKRDKHKCPSKCLSCFTFMKGKKCCGRSEFWGVASRVPSLQATLPPSPRYFR